ncbi:unnamed protein product [Linum trigynum]|uniref:Uncharacterized protein n=1 Tax=Linum trigynum TaxID=586398 RepID=A0AAV2GBZ6_9ROSI
MTMEWVEEVSIKEEVEAGIRSMLSASSTISWGTLNMNALSGTVIKRLTIQVSSHVQDKTYADMNEDMLLIVGVESKDSIEWEDETQGLMALSEAIMEDTSGDWWFLYSGCSNYMSGVRGSGYQH